MNADIKRVALRKTTYLLFFLITAMICFFSCRDKKPEVRDIVKTPAELGERISGNIHDVLNYSIENGGRINDSVKLTNASAVRNIYIGNQQTVLWSSKGKLSAVADSLFDFIRDSKHYGLFPDDFNFSSLYSIRSQLQTDTLAKKDAALWSRNDVLMTDALLSIAQQLKRGRLPFDSLSTRKDTLIDPKLYVDVLARVLATDQVVNNLQELEPTLEGYTALKKGIASFLDSADFRKFTYLNYPYQDSIEFYSQLKTRLFEEKILDSLPPSMDSSGFRRAIFKYQKIKKLKTTGRVSETLVSFLNDTDWERYKRIALSLDKYKLMADSLPHTYVWVNLPAYSLKVVDSDSVVMRSKVIVGAPKTRTPELTSDISNFITYPQWTVPYSIIFKEMLPQIQKNVNYLAKQNLMVVDRNDSVLDPATINWKKLNKNKFPYLIRQREGDDNSLGVLKFNFRNKYAVYLHDTNARWLFSKSSRALSHGCVRVQNWHDLANFLVRNDTIRYPPDTLSSWIMRQEKHVVSGFKRVPIFIRYFTCEGIDGKVKFYDDIYAEDKILTEKYFSKNIN